MGEGPSAISRSVRVTKERFGKSFDIMRRMILVPSPVIGERFIRARAGVVFVAAKLSLIMNSFISRQ